MPKISERGIRVIGLGVGTAKGAMIPDGEGGFVKDESGAVVLSELESGTLRDLARPRMASTGTPANGSTFPRLVAATVEHGRKGRFAERNTSVMPSAPMGACPGAGLPAR